MQAIQDDKSTLADTARKLTEFGRQNLQAYAELSQRLGTSYYNELDNLAGTALKADAPAVKTTSLAKVPVKAATKAPRPAKRKAVRA